MSKSILVNVLFFLILRYKRILGIGEEGITTYNPNSLEVTNQWLYKDVINITPILRNNAQHQVSYINQFILYNTMYILAVFEISIRDVATYLVIVFKFNLYRLLMSSSCQCIRRIKPITCVFHVIIGWTL